MDGVNIFLLCTTAILYVMIFTNKNFETLILYMILTLNGMVNHMKILHIYQNTLLTTLCPLVKWRCDCLCCVDPRSSEKFKAGNIQKNSGRNARIILKFRNRDSHRWNNTGKGKVAILLYELYDIFRSNFVGDPPSIVSGESPPAVLTELI